jgi:short-subunit dehydrogenase
VEGLSEGLEYELKPFGVQVSTILPGVHDTGFIDAIKWSDKEIEASVYKTQLSSLDKILGGMKYGFFVPKSSNISSLIIKMIHAKKI